MKRIVFRILFWLMWPLVWMYAPLRARARVLVVYESQFLAVKPYFGSNVWQLPGGGIKFGEQAVDAAIRELREEVSLDLPKPNNLLPVHTYTEKGLLLRYVLFYHSMTKMPTIVKNNEIAEAKWLSLADLSNCADHVSQAVGAFNEVNLLK